MPTGQHAAPVVPAVLGSEEQGSGNCNAASDGSQAASQLPVGIRRILFAGTETPLIINAYRAFGRFSVCVLLTQMLNVITLYYHVV